MQYHFGRLAHLYDELRSPIELVLIETLVAVGDLRGRRVLDVGCGTGGMLTTLALHYAVQEWGVDVSAEILEVARPQVPLLSRSS
jgi:ubiquinone/menaquinone biosynthesis C-methylase UbiE